jgi:hypothetical protein
MPVTALLILGAVFILIDAFPLGGDDQTWACYPRGGVGLVFVVCLLAILLIERRWEHLFPDSRRRLRMPALTSSPARASQ